MPFGLKKTGLILSLLAQAARLEVANGQNTVSVVGDACQDVWTGEQDEGIRVEVVGQVCTEVIGGNVEFTVTVTKPDCLIEETHICNMPYMSDFGLYTSSYMIAIPEDEAYDFTCQVDDTSYVVAGHVQLSCGVDEDGVEQFVRSYYEVPLECEETIVAGTEEMGFRIPTEDPANPLKDCMDTWAFQSGKNFCYPHRLANEAENCATCFLHITKGGDYRIFNQKGWTLGSFDDHTLYGGEDTLYELELWAKASVCDITQGMKVGTITLDYFSVPGQVTVTYNMDPGYAMVETHLYVGMDLLPLDANGQHSVKPSDFPFMHEGLDFVTTDTYVEGAGGNTPGLMFYGGIHMSAHATVCPMSAKP